MNKKTDTLEEKLTNNINIDLDGEKSQETSNLLKEARKVYEGQKKKKKQNEDVEENKAIFEAVKKDEELKKKAYDFLSELLGVDLYKIENRREIKKAYKKLDQVKANISKVELTLNGKETYKITNTTDEGLITYISSVDPKKKGLYFKEQEITDITVMFKNKEIEHEHTINKYEEQIETLRNQIDQVKDDNYEKDTLIALKKQKFNLSRLKQSHERRIKEINHELDSYIGDLKLVKNKIYQNQKLLDASRKLSNNIKFSLDVIGPDYVSEEGKTFGQSVKNLTELQKMGEKFKNYVTEFLENKHTRLEKIYTRVDDTVSDENGEQLQDTVLKNNKASFDKSAATLKAIRDTYFDELDY